MKKERLVKKQLYLRKESLDFLNEYAIKNNLSIKDLYRDCFDYYISSISKNDYASFESYKLYKDLVKVLFKEFKSKDDKLTEMFKPNNKDDLSSNNLNDLLDKDFNV